MGTMGGGAFFGKVGTFLNDYEFDAVVVDDTDLPSVRDLSSTERLERAVYMPEVCKVSAKYVSGDRIL